LILTNLPLAKDLEDKQTYRLNLIGGMCITLRSLTSFFAAAAARVLIRFSRWRTSALHKRAEREQTSPSVACDAGRTRSNNTNHNRPRGERYVHRL
jgi:hypothetical protein